MANQVKVTLNGAPVTGAVVTVTMAPFAGFAGGYNAEASSDAGLATFPDGPWFFGGSSADVAASYTDAAGNTYGGLGEWGLQTFGNWSPSPLPIALTINQAVGTQVSTQQQQEQKQSQPFNFSAYEPYILLLVIILIAGIGAYLLLSKKARKKAGL